MLVLLQGVFWIAYVIKLWSCQGREFDMKYLPIVGFAILLSLATVSSLEPPAGLFFLGGVIVLGTISIVTWIPRHERSTDHGTHQVARHNL